MSSAFLEVALSNGYIFNNALNNDIVLYPSNEAVELLLGVKSNADAGLYIASSNINLNVQPANSNGSIQFRAGGANLATILGTGYMGLGTAVPVARYSVSNSGTTNSGGTGDFTNVTSNVCSFYDVNFPRIVHKSGDSGAAAVYNYDSNKNVFWGESTDCNRNYYMFRGRGLSVGNTTVPSSNFTLDISGTTRLTGTTDTLVLTGGTNPVSMTLSNSGGRAEIGLAAANDQFMIGNIAGDMVIRNMRTTGKMHITCGGNTSAALTVNDNNNVGIGTTTPATTLDVNGGLKSLYTYGNENDTAGGSGWYIIGTVGSSGTNSGRFKITILSGIGYNMGTIGSETVITGSINNNTNNTQTNCSGTWSTVSGSSVIGNVKFVQVTQNTTATNRFLYAVYVNFTNSFTLHSVYANVRSPLTFTSQLTSTTDPGANGVYIEQAGYNTPPIMARRHSTSQSIANTTATRILFDTTDVFNSGVTGLTYGATGVFTNTSGSTRTYLINAMIQYSPNANGVRLIWIHYNADGNLQNTTARYGYVLTNATGSSESTIMSTSATLTLANNETFSVNTWQTSGGALNVSDANSGLALGYGARITVTRL